MARNALRMEQSNIAASRTEAIEQGKSFYFGDKPCKRGHDKPIRRTRSKACHACSIAYDRDKRSNDPKRRESERLRKRELKRRQKQSGAFNREQKAKHDQAYRRRKAATPEVIAKREARQAEKLAKDKQKRREKDIRELERALHSIGWPERRARH